MSEKSLDIIINKMTEVVEQSQDDIFHISEQTEKEYIKIQEELEVTKKLVAEYIMRSDELEIQVRQSRRKLSEVSKQFGSHNERQIREVYEKTHTLQTELAIVQSEEKTLRDRRDDLERRLVQLMETIDHARNLGRKVSVISSFLQDDFQEMNDYIKTAHEKEKIVLKIIEAQEQERKRISREIHDGPAQSLANVLVRSEIVDLTFRDGNKEEALKEMKVFRESIRQSLQEVRRIIYDLRPMALDDLGLIPTIKKHISTISKYNDIDIQFTLHGEEKRLETPYEVALFRLIQEGLQNAIKHANAKLIKILIEIRKDTVILVIQDDGVGFETSEKNKNDSYGIIGMKERIELLEGDFKITSEINKGTKIKVVIPYKEVAVAPQ
ncbi:MAG TPA: histidine kinase [Pseudogracilibacillus sp.]|nr:histidine kinase [Pseudogracilibacillus sp.]